MSLSIETIQNNTSDQNKHHAQFIASHSWDVYIFIDLIENTSKEHIKVHNSPNFETKNVSIALEI